MGGSPSTRSDETKAGNVGTRLQQQASDQTEMEARFHVARALRQSAVLDSWRVRRPVVCGNPGAWTL